MKRTLPKPSPFAALPCRESAVASFCIDLRREMHWTGRPDIGGWAVAAMARFCHLFLSRYIGNDDSCYANAEFQLATIDVEQ